LFRYLFKQSIKTTKDKTKATKKYKATFQILYDYWLHVPFQIIDFVIKYWNFTLIQEFYVMQIAETYFVLIYSIVFLFYHTAWLQ